MIRALLALILTAAVAGPARAQPVTEIWKCKGRDGRWTYTNDRNEAEKLKCEVVTRQVNVAPASKAPAGSAGLPKETAAERTSARARQRDILEKQLAAEQAGLAMAQQRLPAQQSARSRGE